jgi:hypothetical protein
VTCPDLYEPQLNPAYAAVFAHYGAVADVCHAADPDSKGTVENAVQHTESPALKGRKFESIEAQNEWLAHWKARPAAPRIHSRKKRQCWRLPKNPGEENVPLRPVPTEHFRFFCQVTRTRMIIQCKRHNQALIVLAQRRCDVLFALLRDGTLFAVDARATVHELAVW